mgnify:FL=1
MFNFARNSFDFLIGPFEQAVSPVPDVTFIKRQKTDNFIVLATDGIWDSLSPEQPTNDTLFNFIKERLRNQPLSFVCEEVVDFSMKTLKEKDRYCEIDNTSIILYDCQRSHLETFDEKFSFSKITHAGSKIRGGRCTNEGHFISMEIYYEGFLKLFKTFSNFLKHFNFSF